MLGIAAAAVWLIGRDHQFPPVSSPSSSTSPAETDPTDRRPQTGPPETASSTRPDGRIAVTWHPAPHGGDPRLSVNTPRAADGRLVGRGIPEELARSSWENPFRSDLWFGDGWAFFGDEMRSDSGRQAPSAEPPRASNRSGAGPHRMPAVISEQSVRAVTFRRPYRRLMLQIHVKPIGPPATMEIWLVSPDDGSATRVLLTDSASLAPLIATDRIIRVGSCRRAWNTADGAAVMVGATGNRILVGWNTRRLACTQPAPQSGRLFFFTLIARSGDFRIVQMRIEGE